MGQAFGDGIRAVFRWGCFLFSDFEAILIGSSASLLKRITEEDIRDFVRFTGDDNPLHVDKGFAETTPFKDIVVHGMLGASYISTIIGTKLPGPGALWMSQSFEFLLPVRMDDEITVTCTVIAKNDRERMLELSTEIVNQFGQKVLAGHGKVKVLERTVPVRKQAGENRARVALVSGATGGIGEAICIALAERGFCVAINYKSSESKAKVLVNKLESLGVRAVAIRADISKRSDVENLLVQTKKSLGPVSVLVNNASGRIVPKPFMELNWADLEYHLDVQLKGAFNLMQGCIPDMKEAGTGRIINITSQVLDSAPTPLWTAYTTGKATLAALARSLAVEIGPTGIRVNCVSPGMTDTRLIGDLSERSRLMLARQNPTRRLGRPEDVAAAVCFLASPESDFINGETLRVNGGAVTI